jgi:hypothetical protein
VMTKLLFSMFIPAYRHPGFATVEECGATEGSSLGINFNRLSYSS